MWWVVRVSLVGMVVAVILGMAVPTVSAQGLSVAGDGVACIPIEDNAVAWATVKNNVPDSVTRLYFRRLHDVVEDFYWVRMRPAGDGRYWGLFPKAEDRVLDRHDLEEDREEVNWDEDDEDSDHRWAEWWRFKDTSDHRDPNGSLDDDLIRERASIGKLYRRDWIYKMNDEAFEDWLDQLVNEPAEYFVAVVDADGRLLAKTDVMVTEVRDPDDCEVEFTEQQDGERHNLTIGELGDWQRDKEVFHWLCAGVVTRVDPYNVKRADDVCRACVIAWWQKTELMLPVVAVVPIFTVIDSPPISPSAP